MSMEALKTASGTGQDAIMHGMREWHYAWRQSVPRAQLITVSKSLDCPGLRNASAPDEEAEHLALGSSKLTGCFSFLWFLSMC